MTTGTTPSDGSTAEFIFQARMPAPNPIAPPPEMASEEEGFDEVREVTLVAEEVVSTSATWKGK